jgi:DNA-binding beta-propeller fold protein YncE
MKRSAFVFSIASCLAFALAAWAAGPGYKVTGRIKVGGTGGWDYVYIDSAAKRLYVSHTNVTEVIDLGTEMKVGQITETTGVHGIAVATDLGKGYTSNGRANNVSIFDLKSLATTGHVDTGKNPDAIIYEPTSHRVYTFNGASKDATAIDAKAGTAISTFGVGGKPEFAVLDGKGRIYVNIEDTSELIEIDASKASITKRIKLDGCEDPSGLAMDVAKRRLFSVCGNKVMAITDPDAGKMIATAPIGQGPDGVAFDNGYAFSSNGRDGTITVVGEEGGKWTALETVQTQLGARTIGADPKTHKLYLPAAEYGPPTEGKDGKKGRQGAMVPDSFQLVVVAK